MKITMMDKCSVDDFILKLIILLALQLSPNTHKHLYPVPLSVSYLHGTSAMLSYFSDDSLVG